MDFEGFPSVIGRMPVRMSMAYIAPEISISITIPPDILKNLIDLKVPDNIKLCQIGPAEKIKVDIEELNGRDKADANPDEFSMWNIPSVITVVGIPSVITLRPLSDQAPYFPSII